MRPVCVIVRDGWGYNEKTEGNAVKAASTPVIDGLKEKYPHTLLDASGEAVGLPAGYQGSSEVGHLNMGAGRIVVQELKRIDDGLEDGSLFSLPKWKNLIEQWKARQSRLHLMGLLQDEGVHAHQEHLFKIMRRARKEYPDGAIVVHPFLDGRDTPPNSSPEYLAKLQKIMAQVGGCTIGAFMGRYYAMDRSENWPLTDRAFNCLVHAQGEPVEDPIAAVQEAYKNEKTPDGQDMFDEYIRPHIVKGYDGMHDGDCVVHTNFRQDRAIQLTKAFVEPDYPGDIQNKPDLTYLGLTRYYNEFNEYLIGPMDEGGGMDQLLGQVISEQGFKQLRIAETQKFRHVTSFFNGKSTRPYPGEEQVEIKGRFDASSFASHPEMDAERVTDELLKRLTDDHRYALVVVNFANGDMVGHTGVFEAARKAVETVDACVGRLVDRMLELNFQILVTADHGNAEQMIDYETGMIKTSHTTYPVECIYVAADAPGGKLIERGKLSDIAPTALKLLGLSVPKEMTANLII
jgi:2,3-bisphosphoglycerate-independent phosphoglycerate mutase